MADEQRIERIAEATVGVLLPCLGFCVGFTVGILAQWWIG